MWGAILGVIVVIVVIVLLVMFVIIPAMDSDDGFRGVEGFPRGGGRGGRGGWGRGGGRGRGGWGGRGRGGWGRGGWWGGGRRWWGGGWPGWWGNTVVYDYPVYSSSGWILVGSATDVNNPSIVYDLWRLWSNGVYRYQIRLGSVIYDLASDNMALANGSVISTLQNPSVNVRVNTY